MGEVKVTGTSSLSSAEVQQIAHMDHGDRLTAARVSGSLQRLRKRFQKQNRALAQVSIADQPYHPETNTVDFTFQIDPGPVVVIYARGFPISRGVLKKEIPVYEENAVDDDLLNEGKRNLLDYSADSRPLRCQGRNSERVRRQDVARDLPDRSRAAAQAGPGRDHWQQGLSGYRETAILPADSAGRRFLSHGRYSEALLKTDVATLEGLYRSNGFRQVKIQTKVDDNYHVAQQAGGAYSH